MSVVRSISRGQTAFTSCDQEIVRIHSGPRVTCLMVTRDRVEQAIASIGFYIQQTYENRSLVIVCESCQHKASMLKAYVDSLQRSDIKWVRIETGTMPLGALRNVSIAEADGELLCQWDDDDFYHPQRLSLQFDALLTAQTRACFLGDHLQYMTETNSMFWCDWYNSSRGQSGFLPAAPQTILWWKAAELYYHESGPFAQKSEDAEFMRNFIRAESIAILGECGYAYVYVTHRTNTWAAGHHFGLVKQKGLDRAALRARRQMLHDVLRLYPFQYPLFIRDKDGTLVYKIQRN